MKIQFILLIILVTTCGLWGEAKNDIFTGTVSLTTGFFSGGKAGIGRVDIYDEFAVEYTINYKIDLYFTYKSIQKFSDPFHNIYIQRNRFYNPQRTKSFFILKGGIMWFEMGDWFINTSNKSKLYSPLATIGYGYSFKLYNHFFLRPSIDVGIQLNLVNIELSCTF